MNQEKRFWVIAQRHPLGVRWTWRRHPMARTPELFTKEKRAKSAARQIVRNNPFKVRVIEVLFPALPNDGNDITDF